MRSRTENGAVSRKWRSPILDKLGRPFNPESRVESEERIRCDIMNAIEEALATQSVRPTPLPPSGARLKAAPNPFLQPRMSTDPPPPWSRRARAMTTSASSGPRVLPIMAVALLTLAIGIVLHTVPHARDIAGSALMTSAKVFSRAIIALAYRLV